MRGFQPYSDELFRTSDLGVRIHIVDVLHDTSKCMLSCVQVFTLSQGEEHQQNVAYDTIFDNTNVNAKNHSRYNSMYDQVFTLKL